MLLLFLYLGLVSGLIFFAGCALLKKIEQIILNKKTAELENKNNSETINDVDDINDFDNKDKENSNKSLSALLKEESQVETELKDSTKTRKQFNILKLFKRKKATTETIYKKENKSLKQKRIKQKNTQKRPRFVALKRFKKQLRETNFKIKKTLNKFKKPLINFISVVVKIVLMFLLILVSYLINLKLNFGEVRFVFVLVFVASFFIAKSLLKLVAIYFINFYNYFVRKLHKTKKQ